MKSEALCGFRLTRLKRPLLVDCWGLANPIKREPKRFAEGGQGALSGIGFRSLQRGVVHLTGGGATPFTRAVTLSNDGCTAGLHRNPYPRSIDSKEGAAIFPGEDTTGFDRLPAPTIKTKDAVGFRDRVPALDIGEFAPIGFAGADVTVVEIAPQGFELFC